MGCLEGYSPKAPNKQSSKKGCLCQSPKPDMLKWLLNLRAPNSEVTDGPRVLWPFCHHQLFGDVLTDRSIWGRVEKDWSQEEGPDKSTLEVTAPESQRWEGDGQDLTLSRRACRKHGERLSSADGTGLGNRDPGHLFRDYGRGGASLGHDTPPWLGSILVINLGTQATPRHHASKSKGFKVLPSCEGHTGLRTSRAFALLLASAFCSLLVPLSLGIVPGVSCLSVCLHMCQS